MKIGFYGCDQKNQSFFFFFFSLTQTNVRSFNFFILFLGFDEIDKKIKGKLKKLIRGKPKRKRKEN